MATRFPAPVAMSPALGLESPRVPALDAEKRQALYAGDSGPLQKLFSNIKLGPGVAPQQRHTAQQCSSAAVTIQPQPGRSGSGGLPSPSPSAPASLPAVSSASASAGSSRSVATPGKSICPPSRPSLLTPSFFKQPAQQSERTSMVPVLFLV